jgi:hypothetical protein
MRCDVWLYDVSSTIMVRSKHFVRKVSFRIEVMPFWRGESESESAVSPSLLIRTTTFSRLLSSTMSVASSTGRSHLSSRKRDKPTHTVDATWLGREGKDILVFSTVFKLLLFPS